MSDTHKTKPPHVQYKQGHCPYEVIHNHERGPCDLLSLEDEINKSIPEGNCYRRYSYDGKNHLCGCDVCTRKKWRKQSNRSKRKAVKTKLRNIEKDEYIYDEEVIDDSESKFY